MFFTNLKFVSQDVNWWTGVVWIICGLRCFYQLFGLSFWRHPFTKEHPLVSRGCNATFLQIRWRNKLIYIFDGLRVCTCSAVFHFWVNYSLWIQQQIAFCCPSLVYHSLVSKTLRKALLLRFHIFHSKTLYCSKYSKRMTLDFVHIVVIVCMHCKLLRLRSQ